MARLWLVALTLLLGSCSQMTDVSARYIDGKLAFVPIQRAVDCVRDFAIVERATNRPVWTIAAVGTECVAAMPIRYGQTASTTKVVARRLRPNTIYRIEGIAEGSNYLGGAFVISAKRAWQLTDLPRSMN